MGKLRGALALFAIALACGGTKPNTVPGEKKTYQPLTIKEDAKAPNQAVILGTDEKTLESQWIGYVKSLAGA